MSELRTCSLSRGFPEKYSMRTVLIMQHTECRLCIIVFHGKAEARAFVVLYVHTYYRLGQNRIHVHKHGRLRL